MHRVCWPINNIAGLKFSSNIVPVLLCIYTFFIFLPIFTALQEICFYLSILIALLLAIFKISSFSVKAPLTFPFALLFLWTAVNILYTFRLSDCSDIYGHFIRYLIYYYLLYNFFQTKKWFMILTWVILVSIGLLSSGGIIYFYILLNHEISTRFGFPDFASVNNIGVIMGVGILLALMNLASRYRALNIISLFSLISASAATFLCQSRGSMAGTLVAVAALFHKNLKVLVIVFLIILLIPVMISDSKLKDRFSLGSFYERIGIQIIYWKMIQDRPLVGYGFSGQTYYTDHVVKTFNNLSNSPIMPKQLRYTGPFVTPHNMFTDIAVRTGIIGLLAFLYVLFVFSRSCLMMIRQGHDAFIRKWALCIFAIFISYIIQGMSTDVLLNYQANILYLIFGLATIIWRINNDSKKLQNECIL
jgi:O-antigen ligase